MKNENSCCDCSKNTALVLGVLGSCLVVAGLVCVMLKVTNAPSASAGRTEERLKNLAEIRAAAGSAVDSYAVQDAPHNIYRVPVPVAVKWAQAEWKDPAAGRASLIARLNKSTAAVKNPFE